MGQLGPSQRRLPLSSKTLAPFHEEQAFRFACGSWPLFVFVVVLWTCTHTHTKPGRILATRSTTSGRGPHSLFDALPIIPRGCALCEIEKDPSLYTLKQILLPPPSTAHIDQLYNSPFTHAHTHVPCRAVLSPDNYILVRIVGGYLADYAVFFSFGRRHARIKLFPAVQQTQKKCAMQHRLSCAPLLSNRVSISLTFTV